MKNILRSVLTSAVLLFFTAASFSSCQNDKTSAETHFTGKEVTYTLFQGSDLNVHGTVTFKEKVNGFAEVEVHLEGTEGDITHPAHLHLGDMSLHHAHIGAVLTPLDARTGISVTALKTLSDETTVTYKDLLNMEAFVSIHLDAAGAGRDVILAAGNIGKYGERFKHGKLEVGVCQSE